MKSDGGAGGGADLKWIDWRHHFACARNIVEKYDVCAYE